VLHLSRLQPDSQVIDLAESNCQNYSRKKVLFHRLLSVFSSLRKDEFQKFMWEKREGGKRRGREREEEGGRKRVVGKRWKERGGGKTREGDREREGRGMWEIERGREKKEREREGREEKGGRDVGNREKDMLGRERGEREVGNSEKDM
jgi:hypothetical protein